MPITTAHPSIVLPLLGRVRAGGWVSGLVIGSMIPDILQSFWPSRFPHDPAGLLLLDVPTTFLLAFAFHRLVRARLRRFPGFEDVEDARFHPGWALFAAFLGVSSHLAWDLVTHSYSVTVLVFISRHLRWFQMLDPRAGYPAKFLEHSWYLSSVGGTLVVAGYLAFHLRRRFARSLEIGFAPWVVVALAGILPFLPVAFELPSLVEGSEGRLSRLNTLASHLRVDMVLSLVLVLAAFLAVTRERAPGRRA
jgi:hypothetical protein